MTLQELKKSLNNKLDNLGFDATPYVLEEIRNSGFSYAKDTLAELEREGQELGTSLYPSKYITRLRIFMNSLVESGLQPMATSFPEDSLDTLDDLRVQQVLSLIVKYYSSRKVYASDYQRLPKYPRTLLHKINCDRTKFVENFKSCFWRAKLKEPCSHWFFIITSPASQVPHSLTERMVLELDQMHPDYRVWWPRDSETSGGDIRIPVPDFQQGGTLENGQHAFENYLLTTLSLRHDFEMRKLADFADSGSPLLNYQFLSFNLQMYDRDWEPYTPELIEWISHEFCGPEDFHPRFIFFLKIFRNEQQHQKPKKWLGLFNKPDNHQKLRHQLNRLDNKHPQIHYLGELPGVLLQDIHNWLNDFIHSETVIARILATMQASNKEGLKAALKAKANEMDYKAELPMEDVEEMLQAIVKLHQPSYQTV